MNFLVATTFGLPIASTGYRNHLNAISATPALPKDDINLRLGMR